MRRNDRCERSSCWLWVAVACAIGSVLLATGGDTGPMLASTLSLEAEETTPIVTAVPVSVTTDRPLYRPGERVLVTVKNGLPIPVYAPPPGACAVVAVERLQDGQWSRIGACPTLNVTPTAIPGGSELIGTLPPELPAPNTHGPVVIGPVAPSISPEQGTLSTAVPWKPEDPVREIPEGAVAAPFSTVSGDLAAGTYRIELRFALRPGAPPDDVQTAHSAPFEVAD